MPLPRPPINNMADFIVFVFVTIVAFILISATLGLLLDVIFDPEGDRSAVIGILSDITTSLISALVGYLAGKGQGRQDAQEEEARRQQDEKKP